MSRFQSFTVVVLAACLLMAMAVSAQESQVVEIKRGEVLRVVANTLIVRVEGEGVKTVVVPEDFRFTDDGQELSIHELHPGMQLIGVTITTYETPMAIAEEELETVTRAMVASAGESASGAESMAASAEESMATSAEEASSASSEAAQSGGSAAGGSGTSPALIFLLVLIALGVVVIAAKKLGKAS